MFSEEALADLAAGNAWMALLLALALGFRHAADPDHLAAVATLVSGGDRRARRRAGWLGLAWGTGHATTLTALGLPVVLLHAQIPEAVHRAAEVGVGVLIIVLALRLLFRWWKATTHFHPHRHGALVHAHEHVHERVALAEGTGHGGHEHGHTHELGRSPAVAFGIGLVHGVGGSSIVGVVLVAAFPTVRLATVALLALALGTALSMGLMSAALGGILARGRGMRWIEAALGLASLCFGAWYVVAAVAPA